jgi:hypothetical protein
MADILSAKTGIDEHKAPVSLDQQAMADNMSMDHAITMAIKQPTTPRAAGAAIEVVDFHAGVARPLAASRLRQ